MTTAACTKRFMKRCPVLSASCLERLRAISQSRGKDAKRVVIRQGQRSLFERLKRHDLIYYSRFEGWETTCDGEFLADPASLSRVCLNNTALHALRDVEKSFPGRAGPGKGSELLWRRLAELGFIAQDAEGWYTMTDAGHAFSQGAPRPLYHGGPYPPSAHPEGN